MAKIVILFPLQMTFDCHVITLRYQQHKRQLRICIYNGIIHRMKTRSRKETLSCDG